MMIAFYNGNFISLKISSDVSKNIPKRFLVKSQRVYGYP